MNCTLAVEQDLISLLNANLRISLKKENPNEIDQATLSLFSGDKGKAKLLLDWFLTVAERCRDHESKLNEGQVLMRMWMIGNVDIVEINHQGNPKFSMTLKGKEKARVTKSEDWFKVLLSDKANVLL